MVTIDIPSYGEHWTLDKKNNTAQVTNGKPDVVTTYSYAEGLHMIRLARILGHRAVKGA